MARGAPDQLKRRLGRQTLEIKVADPARADEAARLVTTVIGSQPVTDEQVAQPVLLQTWLFGASS